MHFACPDTKRFFNGERFVRFISCERLAIRKLQQLNAATSLEFLTKLPNNKLETTLYNHVSYYNLKINEQWSLLFLWDHNSPTDVKLVDMKEV
ncbi:MULTISPECIES: type II toxin-antitoxin system RelE/ParE family toxin [Basfia]|nr:MULTISPECIES: type II toxin-antitoxin system RelE/ParE family toxin [Basfia]